MSRFLFQLVRTGSQIVAGATIVHARLQSLRGGQETLVGVLHLSEEEWQEFVYLCRKHGIPVKTTEEGPAPKEA